MKLAITMVALIIGNVALAQTGKSTTRKKYSTTGKTVSVYTPKARQREAVKFLQEQLFTTPKWLLDKNLFSYIGVDNVNAIAGVQSTTISGLLNPRTLSKLVDFEMLDPANAYTVSNLLSDFSGSS